MYDELQTEEDRQTALLASMADMELQEARLKHRGFVMEKDIKRKEGQVTAAKEKILLLRREYKAKKQVI